MAARATSPVWWASVPSLVWDVALIVGVVGVVAGGSASAQPSDSRLPQGRRTVTAERLTDGERIALDGRLDEAAWQRAVPATDFLQQDPNYGGTPTERTEVRILFDRDRLYMGVTCIDSEPDRLLGNTMKRDEFLRADDRFMWTMEVVLQLWPAATGSLKR